MHNIHTRKQEPTCGNIYPSIYPPINPLIHSFVHSFIHPFIRPSFHPSIHYPSIHSFIYSCFISFLLLSFHSYFFHFQFFIHPSMHIQACMHAMCFCNHHPGSEPSQLCRQVKLEWPRYAMWGGSLNTVASFNSNISLQYKNWWLDVKLEMEKRSSHYSCRWFIWNNHYWFPEAGAFGFKIQQVRAECHIMSPWQLSTAWKNIRVSCLCCLRFSSNWRVSGTQGSLQVTLQCRGVYLWVYEQFTWKGPTYMRWFMLLSWKRANIYEMVYAVVLERANMYEMVHVVVLERANVYRTQIESYQTQL